MNRRSFIKSSLALSGGALAGSVWSTQNKIKFGYYYPSESTPAPIKNFTRLLQRAGINAQMSRLVRHSAQDVLSKIQHAEYAGVFMLTNLVSDHIHSLMLLSDGPDAPSYDHMNSWFLKTEKTWDASLQKHGLKRIPFTHSGARRGLWVHQARHQELNDLKDRRVYAEGLWAQILEKHGAKRITNLKSSDIDIFIPSNLYSAQQTGISSKARLHLTDMGDFRDASGSSFDLYLNSDYWAQLDTKMQGVLKSFVFDAGKIVCERWESHDRKLFAAFKQTASIELPILQPLLNPIAARQLRVNYALKCNAPETQLLAQSFEKSFPTLV